MKFRFALLIIVTTILSACNFTLAEDVTPPPGYIAPTPLPTLALSPERAPSIENGAAIYVEKCAPCHGETGLGDGPQGIQLGVTVPAFALPEVARPKSPAQWYTTVTRGVIERFMPPFVSLTDQERWDVVAYITTLHTTEEEIQKGRKIFEANCANCSTEYYENQSSMSTLSTVALARIIRLGNDEIPAFGENLSDDEMWAVAEYLRSLSFDASPLAQATAVPATQTPVAADAGTPSAEGTPIEGTQQAEVQNEAKPGFGSVSGIIENKTGGEIPSNLTVTLRGYEHDFQNPNTVEVLTLEDTVAVDGTFVFEEVELLEGRIFLAEVTYEGIGLTSDFAIVEAGQTTLTLPPLALYEVTDDTSKLAIDEAHIFLNVTSESAYEVLTLYTIRNSSESVVAVSMGNQQEIPFLKFPIGSEGIGYEAMQDSAPFVGTGDGFAMMPNEQPYGILAFSSIVRQKEISVIQPLVLPIASVSIFVPDGLEVEGDLLTKGTPQDIQGARYQMYTAVNLKAGDNLTFTVSGSPKAPSSADASNTPGVNSNLLIGAGGLGIALILVGAWMFLRDRNRLEEDDEDGDENEFESSEDVMDAIIALDDLHRAKKISDEAYQKRRAGLKEILKEMVV